MDAKHAGTGTGDAKEAFRRLPQVDELMRDARVAALVPAVGRELVLLFAAEAIESWRNEIRAGKLGVAEIEKRLARGDLAGYLEALVRREGRRGIRRCINAPGGVLNTALGRPPVHPEAAPGRAEAAGPTSAR